MWIGGVRSPEQEQEKQENIARLVAALKEYPCADCGKEYPAKAMRFDHAHGRKKHDIEKLTTAGLGVILVELAKCDVVCAGCLRKRKRGARGKGTKSSCIEALFDIMGRPEDPLRDVAIWLYVQAGARMAGNIELEMVKLWEVYASGK